MFLTLCCQSQINSYLLYRICLALGDLYVLNHVDTGIFFFPPVVAGKFCFRTAVIDPWNGGAQKEEKAERMITQLQYECGFRYA